MKQLARIIATAITAVTLSLSAHAHKNLPQSAIETLNSAINMMDEGKLDVAADILQELYRMYPDSYSIPYELALTHMWNGNYNKAVELVSPLEKHPDCQPEVFSLLGSAYDELGDPKKALETYNRGLKLFPESGHLWAEKGIVWLRKNDALQALKNFEEGILADPDYAPNYYRAAPIYAQSNTPVWGLMYAEAHQFLSDKQDRLIQMSQLIRSIFENQVTIKGDTTYIKMTTIISNDMMSTLGHYEMGLMLGVDGIKNGWSLDGIKKMREAALTAVCVNPGDKSPDLNRMYILDYQRRVREAGHWDAYNIYVLGAAFPKECEAWFESKANEEAYERFADWCYDNPFILDKDHTIGRLAAEKSKTPSHKTC